MTTHAEYMIELEKLYQKALEENNTRLAFEILAEKRAQSIQFEENTEQISQQPLLANKNEFR